MPSIVRMPSIEAYATLSQPITVAHITGIKVCWVLSHLPPAEVTAVRVHQQTWRLAVTMGKAMPTEIPQ